MERLRLRKVIEETLQPFGFVKIDNIYIYSTTIVDNDFLLKIFVNEKMQVNVKVFDIFTQEEYVLHLTSKHKGNYISKVKEAYDDVLDSFVSKCTIKEIYHQKATQAIIQYCKDKYGTDLDHPFQDDEITSVARCFNNKWYGLFMIIEKKKLGIDGDGYVEVANLKNTTHKIKEIVDYKHYFPGYHMNKKYWFTVLFDEDSNIEEIKQLIDDSYQLVNKK